MAIARGIFEVTLTPGPPQLGGSVNRAELRKAFHGDLQGSGVGVMLSGGDPGGGEAGYVAIEVVDGTLHGVPGSFALQQFGLLHAGEQTLRYAVVPGSGTGELAGLSGTLALTIEPDGTHRYALDYTR